MLYVMMDGNVEKILTELAADSATRSISLYLILRYNIQYTIYHLITILLYYYTTYIHKYIYIYIYILYYHCHCIFWILSCKIIWTIWSWGCTHHKSIILDTGPSQVSPAASPCHAPLQVKQNQSMISQAQIMKRQNLLDLIARLIYDEDMPQTKVIKMHCSTLKNGMALVTALQRLQSLGKPVGGGETW